MMNYKWQHRFLDLARSVATWSKDPSTKCGAVLVSPERRILATGYNGFPAGYTDAITDLMRREYKYDRIVHAEMNAILNAANHGVKLSGAWLFVSGLPICSNCAKHIASAGISAIVIDKEKIVADRWKDSWQVSIDIFKHTNVNVIEL